MDAQQIDVLADLRGIAAVAELIAENRNLKAQLKLRQRAVDRWVPCPDHRDKTDSGRCYVCENERLSAALSRIGAKP